MNIIKTVIRNPAIYLALLFCLIAGAVNAQQEDTTTSDGLFTAARYAAFTEKNYGKAKAYCTKALEKSPGYADIRIFLGRLYAWSKEYDSARTCFSIVLHDQPDNEDAAIASTDVEYWNDNYSKALAVADSGLIYHPASGDLLLRKAKILNAMRQYREADAVVQTILKKDKNNTEALALANRIKDNVALNKIGISYDYVAFDKKFPSVDPWHLVSMDYTRQTQLGSLSGRINYANRFKENGIQYEMDAYPHLSKTFYAYMSAGYSNDVGVFPQWRAGFSLYGNLPKSFEAELGWRYLYFSSATNIVTAYFGKYYKSWLFGLRTYVTPGNSGASQSFNASARYYFSSADNLVGLTVGTGLSPDERAVNQLLKNNLRTMKAALDFKRSFGPLNIVTLNISIINQELQPGIKGNQVQAGAGYQRRF